MGTVKSFRMNDRIENMFNSIKKYDRGSDTEVLTHGVERQFEDYSEIYNPHFRENVINYLKNRGDKELFIKLCDILEPMSYADGYFLEDEVRRFMSTAEADYFFDAVDDYNLNSGDFQKYDKICKMLIKNNQCTEKDFNRLAQNLDLYYEQKK
ncbi:hypothetical protein AALA00_13750 [Lachnospiraceae bacterium 46-15]